MANSGAVPWLIGGAILAGQAVAAAAAAAAASSGFMRLPFLVTDGEEAAEQLPCTSSMLAVP